MQALHQAVFQACERLGLGSTPISKVIRPAIASCKANRGLKINVFSELLSIFEVIVISRVHFDFRCR